MLRNYRDIGGLPTRSGGRIRSGRVFRSAAPAGATQEALAAAIAMNFALIADLRHPAEQSLHPSPWPADWADRLVSHGAAEAGTQAPHEALMALKPHDEAAIDAFYHEIYETIPFDPAYRRMFAKVLTDLPELPGPVLIHCTAGKDRTGMLAGLILEIAGVPREAILEDFLRSGTANDFGAGDPAVLARVRKMFGFDVEPRVLDRMISVQPSYLPRFFDSLESRAGGVEAWLNDLGVNAALQDRLRESLIEN